MTRRGLTMIELVMTMTILAIVAAIALPMFGNSAGGKIAATAILLRDDLEQARFRSVANPAQPRAIVVDSDGLGWRLVDPSAPASAINRDDGSEWVVRLGEDRAVGLDGVALALGGMGQENQKMLAFDESGAVWDRSAQPRIRLSCSDRTQTLIIGAVTGIVRIE